MNAPKLSSSMRRRLSRARAMVSVHAVSGDGATHSFTGTDDYGYAADVLDEHVRQAEIGARIVVSVLTGDGAERVEHPVFDVVLRRQRLTPTGGLQRVWINGPSMPTGGAS